MSSGIVLKDCFKTYTYDQDKSRTPQETISRVRALLKEVDLDILKETVRIDRGQTGHPHLYQPLRPGCGPDHRDPETDG